MADETTEENGGGGAAGMVPIERVRYLSEQRKADKAEIAKLREQIDGLAKTHLPIAEVDRLRGSWDSERQAWDAERAVYQIGITDPEAIEVARTLHSRLPEKDRPPLPDWLRSVKEDPSKAPKALTPYLTQPAAAAQPAAQPAARQSTAGTTTTGASSSALTADQVRELQRRAVDSGDWSEWDRYFPRK